VGRASVAGLLDHHDRVIQCHRAPHRNWNVEPRTRCRGGVVQVGRRIVSKPAGIGTSHLKTWTEWFPTRTIRLTCLNSTHIIANSTKDVERQRTRIGRSPLRKA
jgi:hypothetical protein